MDLVNHLSDRLLFAVPKKGRLQQPTLDLLAGSDIQFRRETRLDIALVKNHPLALIFLPAADIPTFVGEGRVDLGITGWDQVEEHVAVMQKRRMDEARNGVVKGSQNGVYGQDDYRLDTEAGQRDAEEPRGGVEEVLDLGFGRCKLQVQVPENGSIQSAEQLIGKNVVTSFVGLTEQYFWRLEKEEEVKRGVAADEESRWKAEEAKLRTRIMYVGGSVEAACALGVADGIVDLVESGETMKAAGLKAIDTVVESRAVLIQSKRPSNRKLVDLISSRISGVITAQKFVLCQYNIPRSLLAKASQITPGKRAPTVTALDVAAWVAVSSMVEKSKIAVVMDQLTDVGATDILVLNIANTRTK